MNFYLLGTFKDNLDISQNVNAGIVANLFAYKSSTQIASAICVQLKCLGSIINWTDD